MHEYRSNCIDMSQYSGHGYSLMGYESECKHCRFGSVEWLKKIPAHQAGSDFTLHLVKIGTLNI
jgi:hypothetical protein